MDKSKKQFITKGNKRIMMIMQPTVLVNLNVSIIFAVFLDLLSLKNHFCLTKNVMFAVIQMS